MRDSADRTGRRFIPRLRLALFLPTLAALLVGMPVIWALANGLIRRSAENHLDTVLTLVERTLDRELGDTDEEIQRQVRALAAGSQTRITVIAADGAVLADSERTLDQVAAMDNHGSRPEIVAARVDGYGSSLRRSATLDRDFLYVARPVDRGRGEAYFLRLAEPLTASETLRRRLTLWVLVASLAALVAMAIISLWLDREHFRPLRRLVAGAEGLAAGRLDSRLQVPRSEEVATLTRALNNLAERVQEQVERAGAEGERLQLIADSMVDGLLVTDSEARVITANPAFRRLFQVRGDVAGHTIQQVTGLAGIKRTVVEALETGSVGILELETPDRPPRTLSVTCSALDDGSGGIVAFRDITELLLLGEVRRDLVANVSHELKTPLTAIRGYAETLVDGALEDGRTARLFTERILQQCARLEALLNDLLTLARLEKDDREPETERLEMRQIVEEAAEVLQTTARDRQVELRRELDSVTLDGDAQALTEICLNLIENAIKYNRAGGAVTIGLTGHGGWAELVVRDTGRGIPAEAQPRIFERFYRVDRGRSRSEGGTGLGLSIVKHAVESHGGTVSVESELGRGTTFRVRLPTEQVGD